MHFVSISWRMTLTLLQEDDEEVWVGSSGVGLRYREQRKEGESMLSQVCCISLVRSFDPGLNSGMFT